MLKTQEAEKPSPPAVDTRKSDPRVLLYAGEAEDVDLIRETFAKERVACTIVSCITQPDFLQALESAEDIDSIIIDYQLHHQDPKSAIRSALGKHPEIPTFVFSGFVGEEAIIDLHEMGATEYFSKSWIKLLPHVVGNVVRERRVTNRVKRALWESEQHFRQVTQHIDEVLWLCTADGKEILFLSWAFRGIFGVDPEEFYQNPGLWVEFVHPDDWQRYQEAYSSRALQGHEFSIDYRIVRRDGQIRFLRDRGFPILDDDGVVSRLAGIIRDVTEEKRLHEELRLAQKMESVGQLAAGIAHEINTPAQFIGDNLRFLKSSVRDLLALVAQVQEQLANDEPTAIRASVERLLEQADFPYLREELPSALDQSLDGIDRIVSIVRAMKDFSHPGTREPERVDLNELVKSAVTVSRNEWKYLAEMTLDLSPDLPLVSCFRQTLSQVLVNLIVNAAQAIGEVKPATQGMIKISTRCDETWAEISIADTGRGIPEAIRGKIFDQFFTTKEVGKGTGQGLAMAWNTIVDAHHGSIQVDSVVGVGSTFTLRIPCAGPQASNTEVAA